ncbi:MAG: alginate O-acetyltransferase AlgF [Alphaproteobacteria bacterium]
MLSIQRSITGFLLLTALAVMPKPSFANPDAGLYDPLPPEGSAFIRFIGDYNDTGSDEATLNGKAYEYVEFKEITSYFVVPEGETEISIGDAQDSYSIEAGKFYSVVQTGENDLALMEDKPNENRAKALLNFYNLTENGSLSVKTNDGSVEVIEEVSDAQSGHREINPVKVNLAVYDGDTLIKDLGSVSMDRSNSYNIVAFNEDAVIWSQSSTNTTR